MESKVEDDKNVNNIDDDFLIIYDSGNDCLMTKCDINWVVDSHVSFHVTPNWNFFTTYKIFYLRRNKDVVQDC